MRKITSSVLNHTFCFCQWLSKCDWPNHRTGSDPPQTTWLGDTAVTWYLSKPLSHQESSFWPTIHILMSLTTNRYHETAALIIKSSLSHHVDLCVSVTASQLPRLFLSHSLCLLSQIMKKILMQLHSTPPADFIHVSILQLARLKTITV